MIGHPSEARLLGFQDGTLGAWSRRRTAGHLAGCQDCRNLVQDHRSTRTALQLAPAAAPAGVLERALATRAAGTILMLPVADPEDAPADAPPRRRGRQWSWRWPRMAGPRGLGASLFRVGALAGSIALVGAVVTNVVSTTPVFSLGISDEGWARFRQGIIDFDPLGFGSASDVDYVDYMDYVITMGFERPLGAPVVVHPDRLQPYSAVYRTRHFSPASEGGAPRLTVETLDAVRLFREQNWVFERAPQEGFSDGRFGPAESFRIEMDPVTLAPVSAWSAYEVAGANAGTSYRYLRTQHRAIVGSELIMWVNREGTFPVGVRVAGDEPRIARPIRYQPRGTVTMGEGHLTTILQASTLTADWRGAVDSWQSLVQETPPPWWVTSLEVEGSAVITVPAGTFETWVVRSYDLTGPGRTTRYLRKGDGLVVRTVEGPYWPLDAPMPTEAETTIEELQSISSP